MEIKDIEIPSALLYRKSFAEAKTNTHWSNYELDQTIRKLKSAQRTR